MQYLELLEELGLEISDDFKAAVQYGEKIREFIVGTEAPEQDDTSAAQEDVEYAPTTEGPRMRRVPDPTTPPRRPHTRSQGPVDEPPPAPQKRRQRRIGLEPVEEEFKSQSDFSYSTNMPTSGARHKVHGMEPRKTSPNDGEEVNVVPPPAKIAKVIADYTTIKLPWHHREITELTPGNWNSVRLINMNSPSNPSANFVSHLPMGWTNWTANYEFYRVLSCEINIQFRYVYGLFEQPFTDFKDAAASNTPGCFSTMVGYELTEDGAKVYQNAFQMIEGKHSKVKWLDPRDIELIGPDTAVATHNVLCAGGRETLSFHYQPELWDTHVHESGIEARWTAVANVSDVQHYLAVHVMTPGDVNDRMNTGDSILIRTDFNVNYTVQFREAMEGLFTRNTSSV